MLPGEPVKAFLLQSGMVELTVLMCGNFLLLLLHPPALIFNERQGFQVRSVIATGDSLIQRQW